MTSCWCSLALNARVSAGLSLLATSFASRWTCWPGVVPQGGCWARLLSATSWPAKPRSPVAWSTASRNPRPALNRRPSSRSTQMNIHPTAIVDPSAKIPASCCIGPYCVVGEVEMGENCELFSHVVLDGPTKLGKNNKIYPFAAVGTDPQDVTFAGEVTRLEMGDHNVVREYVTINRGTAKGGGVTCIGSHVLIMAYTHIGHDSFIGDHVMLVNAATLAGHVTVEEWAVVGALCPVHQFVRIGAHSYIGGGSTITQDVLPYSMTSAERNTH